MKHAMMVVLISLISNLSLASELAIERRIDFMVKTKMDLDACLAGATERCNSCSQLKSYISNLESALESLDFSEQVPLRRCYISAYINTGDDLGSDYEARAEQVAYCAKDPSVVAEINEIVAENVPARAKIAEQMATANSVKPFSCK